MADAEVEEDLGADAVVAQVGGEVESLVGVEVVFLLQLVGESWLHASVGATDAGWGAPVRMFRSMPPTRVAWPKARRSMVVPQKGLFNDASAKS